MEHYLQPLDATQLPAWQALREQRARMQDFSLREAFASDPQRFARYSLSRGGLLGGIQRLEVVFHRLTRVSFG